jgi:hypothetical protein
VPGEGAQRGEVTLEEFVKQKAAPAPQAVAAGR